MVICYLRKFIKRYLEKNKLNTMLCIVNFIKKNKLQNMYFFKRHKKYYLFNFCKLNSKSLFYLMKISLADFICIADFRKFS